jgi:conjugative transposon TraK protein
MFKQMKNIDSAFRLIRSFTLFVIGSCVLMTGLAFYKSYSLVAALQDKVYILANGKALEAYAADRKDNIAVEARDHIKSFHLLFFTLDPDEKVIQENVTKALYLSDASAKKEYDNLKEKGYYSNVIAGNISQHVTIDSVAVDIGAYPYHFRCYATQSIIRTTSIVSRNLITQGDLRNVSRSDNNPHGFLIERWITIENNNIKVENR